MQEENVVKNSDPKELIDGSSNLIDLFHDQTLITTNDLISLEEAKEFVVSTYTDVPMYRSLPIKLFGVLNNDEFPTAESKFWQCKVEAETHSNELIREIHDYEISKLNIEKRQYLITKLIEKQQSGDLSEEDMVDISFDIREQQINLSRMRFEIKQLEKRIKYRIEEVTEWKKISEGLKTSKDFSTGSYVKSYVNTLKYRYQQKLHNPDLKEDQKVLIQKQIDGLTELYNKV